MDASWTKEWTSGSVSPLFQIVTTRLGGRSSKGTTVSSSGGLWPSGLSPSRRTGSWQVGGPEILTGVRDYLRELRDETWRRRDAAMSAAEIVAEVKVLLIERHPDWAGQDWIERGVGCLCTEHTEHTEHTERLGAVQADG